MQQSQTQGALPFEPEGPLQEPALDALLRRALPAEAGVWDELRSHGGALRPAWRRFPQALPPLASVPECADDLDRGGAMTTVEAAVERWFTPAFRAAHPELVDKRVRKVLANDPLGYAAAYRVFAMSEFADRLEYIAAPTLIVTGEHDPGSSVRMARLMRDRIPDSLIRVLPDLRHSLLVEAPGLVATLVDDFLAGRLRSEDWDGCGVRPPGEHAPRFTDDADLREGPA